MHAFASESVSIGNSFDMFARGSSGSLPAAVVCDAIGAAPSVSVSLCKPIARGKASADSARTVGSCSIFSTLKARDEKLSRNALASLTAANEFSPSSSRLVSEWRSFLGMRKIAVQISATIADFASTSCWSQVPTVLCRVARMFW